MLCCFMFLSFTGGKDITDQLCYQATHFVWAARRQAHELLQNGCLWVDPDQSGIHGNLATEVGPKHWSLAKSFLQAMPLKPSEHLCATAALLSEVRFWKEDWKAVPGHIGFKLLSHESLQYHHQLLAKILRHDLRMKAAMCIFLLRRLLKDFTARTPGHHPFQWADGFSTYICSAAGTSRSWRAWLVRSPQKHQRTLRLHQKTFFWCSLSATDCWEICTLNMS